MSTRRQLTEYIVQHPHVCHSMQSLQGVVHVFSPDALRSTQRPGRWRENSWVILTSLTDTEDQLFVPVILHLPAFAGLAEGNIVQCDVVQRTGTGSMRCWYYLVTSYGVLYNVTYKH